jgi:hypothetical protein
MAIHETYIDGYRRYIKISVLGKSDEARKGAQVVVRELLRALRGLGEEDQTYDAVMEFIESLSAELPTLESNIDLPSAY